MAGSGLARYRILGEIGGRAGSRTLKALGPDHESCVVIRVLPVAVACNPQLLQRLVDSQRAVARIQHPNILPLIGSGMVEGRPYIVTPYAEAGSLQDRLKAGALAALDLAGAVEMITAALDHAHAQGVIHGHLKPTDILFDEEGRVLVAGLGLASVLRELPPSEESEPHEPRCTYLAPEVAAGAEILPASDQYSLALIVLEMLSGCPGTEALKVLQSTSGAGLRPTTQPQKIRPNLPTPVVRVLQRALAEDPAQRFASVADMNRALRVAMGLETTPEEHPAPPTRPRPTRRRRTQPMLAVAGLLAGALCVVFTYPALSAGWSKLTGTGAAEPSGTAPAPDRQAPALPTEAGTLVGTVQVAVSDGADAAPAEGGGETETGGGVSWSTPTSRVSQEPAGTLPGAPTAGPTDEPSPTPSPGPASTPTTMPTATQAMTATPPSDPTVRPQTCNASPGHPHYCTPTPGP